jgi:Ni,Fe-hydrogenase I cytochrome b subunit
MLSINVRVVVTGAVVVLLAVGFFLGMATLTPKSNNPVAMLWTVGDASGVLSAVGIVMMIYGIVRKK